MPVSRNSAVIRASWNCTFSKVEQCWECILRASSLAWAFQLKGKSFYLIAHGNVQHSKPIKCVYWCFLTRRAFLFFFFFSLWHSLKCITISFYIVVSLISVNKIVHIAKRGTQHEEESESICVVNNAFMN